MILGSEAEITKLEELREIAKSGSGADVAAVAYELLTLVYGPDWDDGERRD